MSDQDKQITEKRATRVSSTDLLSENELAARRLAWVTVQPDKVAEIYWLWLDWQWNELTDGKLIEKIGEILFRDYPKRVVQIPDNDELSNRANQNL